MRRRIIAAAAATLIAVSLAGCASGATDEGSGTTDEGAAEAGGLIAIITPSPDNPFFKAEADAAQAEAEESRV